MAGASELQNAINRLVAKETGWQKFVSPPAKGAKPGAKSTGLPAQAGSASGFDEKDYAEREYWPAQPLTSSDGVFTIEVEPIKSILLTTGQRMTFKEPPLPAP